MIRRLLISALLAAAGPALAVDGLLDSSFGILSTGRNVIAIDQGLLNTDKVTDTLVTPDGSIYLVGTSFGSDSLPHLTITKMTRDGILDLSFGTNGTVLTAVPNAIANRAKFDADGNILIAGSRGFTGTDRDFLLCRYDTQGQPVAFSGLGMPCAMVAFDIGTNRTDAVNDFIIQSNGKITLVGSAGQTSEKTFAAVARLLPDGTDDLSFSTDGHIVNFAIQGGINTIHAIAQNAAGRLIVVGETGSRSSVNGTEPFLAYLTTAGNFDPTFNNGLGYATYEFNVGAPFHRNEVATRVKVLANGKILMAGTGEYGSGADQKFGFVYRINPTAVKNVDLTFGAGGDFQYTGGYSFELGDILQQSDSKIVLVGTRRPTSGPAQDMEILRLRANGSLDTASFGMGGRTNIDFVLPGEIDFGTAGALQNGRLIVAGYSLRSAPANYDLTVAGLNLDLIFAHNFDGQ